MELWIRSQNREKLTKVSEIHLENTGIDICISDCENDFGRYKSKERALEVLDEIQKYILLPNNDNSAYVYEMPQE